MTSIDRIRVPWNSAPGGPGVSTFYALDGASATIALRLFFNAVKAFVVAPIVWTFPAEGDTITAETGVLEGGWSGVAQASVSATGSTANMANAVGWIVNWNTGIVLSGHRVRGRTFFVPAPSAVLSGGTLNDTVPPDIITAATTMLGAVPGNFVVWSRPFAGTPEWTDARGVTHAARAGHGGGVAPIATATVPDFGAVLTSRRD